MSSPSSPTLDAIIDPTAGVQRIRDGLYSSLPLSDTAAQYDRISGVYDGVVGRELYHRIFWGTSRATFTRLAVRARDAAGDGWLLENACGSLLFTAGVYRHNLRPPTLLIDRSRGMLDRAAKRLGPRSEPGERPTLLHGDASKLPVRDATITSVLSLNLLHVPCDVPAIVGEAARVLIPDRGRFFVSSLVRSGRWSDAYGDALSRRNILAPLRTVDQLHGLVEAAGFSIERSTAGGNLCCLEARPARRR